MHLCVCVCVCVCACDFQDRGLTQASPGAVWEPLVLRCPGAEGDECLRPVSPFDPPPHYTGPSPLPVHPTRLADPLGSSVIQFVSNC